MTTPERIDRLACPIAAYRDRYGITGPRLLGDATTDLQRIDRARAEALLRRVESVAASTHQPQAERGRVGIGL